MLTENTLSSPAVQKFTELIPCPICGSEKFDVIYPPNYPKNLDTQNLLKTYSSSSDSVLMDQLVDCEACTLKYLNPRVRSDIIMSSYSNAVDPTFLQQNEQRISTFSRVLNKIIQTLSIPKGSRVLDIGCAGGAFPKAAHDLGMNVTGIEPSRWLTEQGRQLYKLDLRAGILSDFQFDKKTFKLITLWDVIEHLTHPDQVLQQISDILADDGYFIVNYPDYGSLARKAFGARWPFFLSVHLYYFDRKTIRQYLEKNGFEVVQIKPFWQTLELGYVAKRAAHIFSVFTIFQKLVGVLGLNRFPFTYNMGQTLVIARKRR